MGALVLRLAGPVQSWAGYRLLANAHLSPTAPVPRKSAVAGLVGACIGSRDLDALAARFDLHVRVDRANPMATDFQVIGPLPGTVKPRADRAEKIRQVAVSASVPSARNGGNFPTGTSLRGFLPHCEFVVTITTDDDTTQQWLAAFKEPVFMPYLGRKANAPAYPFVLGASSVPPITLLSELPRVHLSHIAADSELSAPVRVYQVLGDYHSHRHIPLGHLTPPADTREGQLTWVSQHLSR
jgi:CRISPR system Cascade subunit CasD